MYDRCINVNADLFDSPCGNCFFVVSLCNFIAAKKQYKAEPNEKNEQKKNTSKTLLIISSIIMGVLLAIIIGFIAMMYTAIAYM